jgi:hypothetical protein
MRNFTPAERKLPLPECRWRLRDIFAAIGLFLASAAVVLWQNAHLTVLWDASYTLETSARIALGQMPYRDFPLAHAPLTFLIQAAIIRLAGRVFLHHILYAAIVGGSGTVLTWRIALNTLRGRVRGYWTVSILMAAPLSVLGIYSILPFPSYDCDCAFSILLVIPLLQRVFAEVGAAPKSSRAKALFRPFIAGAALPLPKLRQEADLSTNFLKRGALVGIEFLQSVVARLAVNVGLERENFSSESLMLKYYNAIDKPRRSQGVGTVFLGLHRTERPFELAHACVAIQRDKKRITKTTRLL